MELLSLVAGFVAGAVASVAGFGIGSVLTPLLAVSLGTRVAVALVSVPHVLGTAIRFLKLRRHVDRRLLLSFGLASAAGGLAGALIHAGAADRALGIVFGALLVFAGIMGLTGLNRRLRMAGPWAWVAGVLSGFLGGLVGNQGGIRAAGLQTYALKRDAYVATATAAALIVDGARMPVYLAREGRAILAAWPVLAAASAGVVLGTLLGTRLLGRIPEPVFYKVVSGFLLLLGLWFLVSRTWGS